MVISVILTAVVFKYVFASYEWDWVTCFMTASILCATDPVAVVASLHTLGAPEKLSTLIEAESLLNDGSAFVLFLIFEKVRARVSACRNVCVHAWSRCPGSNENVTHSTTTTAPFCL